MHATFVAWADSGEVRLSAEHTRYRWTAVDHYVSRFCHEGMEELFPDYAVWFRQVRFNCTLVNDLLRSD